MHRAQTLTLRLVYKQASSQRRAPTSTLYGGISDAVQIAQTNATTNAQPKVLLRAPALYAHTSTGLVKEQLQMCMPYAQLWPDVKACSSSQQRITTNEDIAALEDTRQRHIH